MSLKNNIDASSENNSIKESIYLNAPFAHQALDKEGIILNVNNQWCKETGYSREEVSGILFKNLIIEEHRKLYQLCFEKLIKEATLESTIFKLVKKDKKIITIKYDGCITVNDKGKFLHTSCILQNITEQIAKEEAYRRKQELEKLRTEIWRTAAIYNNEQTLIQKLLNKAGPVLGSENLSFMPYKDSSKNIIVDQIWRLDGTDSGIGDSVPRWIFKQFKKKSHIYFSFDKLPDILKPVLLPFQKKYGTKTTLVITYGDKENPRGYITSQTYNYEKIYTDDEINLLIELSNIIYLKTKQLQSQKKLKESEERLKNFTQVTNEAIIIHKDGIIKDMNPSAFAMFKIKQKKLKDVEFLDFVHPNYKDIVRRRIKEKRSDLLELKLIKADGTVFYGETIGKAGIYHDEPVRIISINDISKRKESEKEILKLSATVEQSPLSIVITDLNGNLEYTNPRFLQTTGYTKEEVIGGNPRILSTGYTSKEEYKIMWDTILSGKVWIGEFLNKRKDGSQYWEEATIAPVKNELGEIENIVGLKVNISEKKLAEQKLIKSQKELEETVKARDKLISIISHDLRNPFNAILGFSEIMVKKSKEQDYEDFDELSKYIQISATQSFELLENLLHWSRVQTGRLKYSPEDISLKDVTSKIFDLLKANAEEKNISLIIETKNDININADKFMFDTIIRNLISNAVKFTPQNGKVSVSYVKDKTGFKYSVKDSGIGIKKEDIPKLFKAESSYTTSGTKEESGTGLGLILCKEFVDHHKGEIIVESETGKGSTFIITIPNILNAK